MALVYTQPLIYLLTTGSFVDAPEEPVAPPTFLSGTTYINPGSAVTGMISFNKAVMLESPFVTDSGGGTPATLPIDADPPFPPVWPYTWNPSLFWGRENLTQNLRCVRGNTLKFNFHITQNGENLDITGCTLTLTAKWDVTDTSAVFQCTIGAGLTITDATTGSVEAVVSSSQSSTGIPLHEVPLFYDVEMILAGEVSTVLYGVLTISPNVTDI